MASLRFAVFAISCALLAASAASLPAAVFNVGDERGWAVPSGNGTETYNHWAKRNRFQVGDILSTCSCTSNQSLYFSHGKRVFGLIDRVPPRSFFGRGDAGFRYTNDSVLLVSHDDYKQCNTETPLSRFTSGDTKFRLDGAGPFYFISGVPGHCEAGQRMIARVRAPSSLTGAPAAAPGMPPTVSAGGAAPTPAATLPAAPSSVVVGSGSASTPTPSPTPTASGASRRSALSVASRVVVGLVIVGVVTLFVVV
jgi:hypothetical protein